MSVSTTSTRAFIALGSNLANPLQQIDKAILALSAHADIQCLRLGKVYQSKPHGPQDQPDFMNSVLEINTTLKANDLLAYLHQIEQQQHRQRDQRWGPRTVDLDIILYGDIICETEALTIPHPRAYQREFVLFPLADLDDTLHLPPHGSVAELCLSFPPNCMQVIRDVTTYNG